MKARVVWGSFEPVLPLAVSPETSGEAVVGIRSLVAGDGGSLVVMTSDIGT